MRLSIVVTCLCVVALRFAHAEEASKKEEGSEGIAKLEVVELAESESELSADDDRSDVQIKRDSGYPYSGRPSKFRFSSGGQSAHRGRIVSRHPSQISRPFNKYGPPSHQNSPFTRPTAAAQQQRDKFHHQQGHHSHQSNGHQSGNKFLDNHNGGLFNQDIPSPIRNLDFAEISPIAGQNNEPFGSNNANYLPPRNQKLPGYSPPDAFSPQQALQNSAIRNPNENAAFQNENVLQPQGANQISDAALFLAQNAQAIEQLYGAPAGDQDFAPTNGDFSGQTNQIQSPNAQLQNIQSTTQNVAAFNAPLPSYASGVLNPQESLQQIQSLEKDRLIVQLQRALAESQSQNFDNQGRYVQNQDLSGSLTTTSGPTRFPLNYGFTSTTQSPVTTTVSSTATSIGASAEGANAAGTSQVSSSASLPGQAPLAATAPVGFPLYGGFLPTFVTGSNVLTNIPTYGTGILAAAGSVTPVQPTAPTSPTHFGLPIPTDQVHKPAEAAPPPATQTPAPPPKAPTSPEAQVPPVVRPPLHPLHPVTPPVYTPSVQPQHPTYGVQTSLVNSLLYKPLKGIYPIYYYPNVAYQLQKPVVPTFPWSYAPSYGTQAKPQIWK